MVIAIVANTSWNIRNFRLGLIKCLIEFKHTIIVIAPYDNFSKEIEEIGIKFIPISKLNRKGQNPVKDIQLTFEINHILKREKIDIALFYTIKPNIYGSIATFFTSTKSICTVTGLGYTFLNGGVARWISSKLYRLAFSRADIVVFQNEDDKQLFENLHLVKPQKTHIIKGSGINSNYYFPQENKKSTNSFSFLFIGRLLTDKGIQEFIDAANLLSVKYPNALFEIVGELDKQNPAAISEEQLKRWLKNPCILYKGHTNDTKKFIAEADVIVLPSYREGLPKVILEALSMEKPVITTDAPGCKDTVDDGINGYLVKVKDVGSLVEAMTKIIEIGDLKRINMGKKGREKILKEFDEKIIIHNYIDLIESFSHHFKINSSETSIIDTSTLV